MQFCVCFLKMFRPLKGWHVWILNNLHFPMVEGITDDCKADDFCLFIGQSDEISKKLPGIVIQFRI